MLAAFQGPQAYVTPSWYPSKHEHGKVVPTWNYAVVHVRGPLLVHDDREWLRGLVSRLTDSREADRPQPWGIGDAPEDYIDRMLGAIVGIEIPVRSIEGKWKVSQNRQPADRAGVAAACAKATILPRWNWRGWSAANGRFDGFRRPGLVFSLRRFDDQLAGAEAGPDQRHPGRRTKQMRLKRGQPGLAQG